MTGEFIKVKCEKCKNEQVIFSKASCTVNCLVCGDALAQKTGGKVRISAKVVGPVQ